MKAKDIWRLITVVVNSWVDDYAPSMGAALAYYTLFSIARLLLIVISIAGLMFGADAAHGEIFAQLQGLMGAQGAAGSLVVLIWVCSICLPMPKDETSKYFMFVNNQDGGLFFKHGEQTSVAIALGVDYNAP